MRLLIIFLVLLHLHFSWQRSTPSSSTYKAAVVEYAPPKGITPTNKDEYYRHNVAAYTQLAKKAARMDADIIVFPEYGLVSLGVPYYPNGSLSLATEVPGSNDGVNPCLDNSPSRYEMLRNLSCSARENSIYIVVNLPEKKPQSSSPDIFYNTNVVFDRNGTVIARYRKTHLFGEKAFSKPSQVDHTFFDTDFGVRFGVFICFDLMFEEPGVKLVREFGVNDIVFSTAWMSELPFLTALQAQAAWAHATGVNFLASGYNSPEFGSGGSGIYSGQHGVIAAIMPDERGSFLVVGEVPKNSFILSARRLRKGIVLPFNYPPSCIEYTNKHCEELLGYPQFVGNKPVQPSEIFLKKENIMSYLLSKSTFQPTEFFLKKENLKSFRFIKLTPSTTNILKFTLGMDNLTCHFKLSMNFKNSSHLQSENEKFPYSYHLIAFDGLRTFDGLAEGGLQVCAVILCGKDGTDSCGSLVQNPDQKYSNFETLEITGTFNDHSLLLPATLKDQTLFPIPTSQFEFDSKTLSKDEVQASMKITQRKLSFLTFGIYSRNFVKDPVK